MLGPPVLQSIHRSQVAGYPGALCNVTYEIPSPCGEVFSLLTQQMQDWDNSTACGGGCEQRFYLSPKPGPPPVPATLEGTGEECTRCPCGQKCLYVHTETSDEFVKGKV